MRLWAAISMVIGLASAGCGAGDFCSSDVSVLAGTWQVTLSSGGDAELATVVIDENGDVSVTASGSYAWSCDLTQDQVCDLEVHCAEVGGTGEFTFALQRK